MSQVCELTGKKPLYGNKVSHSNRHTRRRWNINIQNKTVFIPELKVRIRLKLSTEAIKIISKHGGLAQAIHKVPEKKLSEKLVRIKKKLKPVKKLDKKVEVKKAA